MWIGIAAVIVIAIAAVGWTYLQRQRRLKLRERFGPEYEKTVRETGTPAKADAVPVHRGALQHREPVAFNAERPAGPSSGKEPATVGSAPRA